MEITGLKLHNSANTRIFRNHETRTSCFFLPDLLHVMVSTVQCPQKTKWWKGSLNSCFLGLALTRSSILNIKSTIVSSRTRCLLKGMIESMCDVIKNGHEQ